MKLNLKSILPHLVAVVLFVVLPSIYFSPLYKGYSLKQSDIRQFQGMSKEIFDYKLAHNGAQTYWTNAMFSGMPSYQISAEQDANWLTKVDQLIKLGLPRPVGILFISMLGFYILGLCLRINPWLSMIGAVGVGFSTINILYIGAGHMSKVNAIAYMAPALGGMLLAFRGRWLLGAGVFAFFLGLNISANHLQMTYYLGFLLAVIGIGEVLRLALAKNWSYLIKSVAALVVAAVLSLLANASLLLSTLEYSKYTTRGTSELSIKPANGTQAKEGLSTDYILEYNYGKNEILSIYAPDAKGAKDELLGNDEQVMANADYTYSEQLAQMNRYWGGQRMSGGAFYFGAFMLALFVLGLIFVQDALRWPVLILSILAIFLASNQLNTINDFFLHKVPMYTKFRDSKMILVLLQVMVPMMAMLFLDRLVKQEAYLANKKAQLIGLGVVLGSALLLFAVPSISGSFLGHDEVKQFADAAKQAKDAAQASYISGLKQALISARIDIYKADMQRSLLLVILAAALVFVLIRTQLNKLILVALAGIIVLADQWSVAKRYLDTDDSTGEYRSYQTADAASLPYAVSPADLSILAREKSNQGMATSLRAAYPTFEYYQNATDQQTLDLYARFGALNLSSNYRVFNLNGTMAETNTSFFHKSIGGYHGAKLKRYQELIDFKLPAAMQGFSTALNAAKNEKFRSLLLPADITKEQAQKIFDSLSVPEVKLAESAELFNLLNAKYIISDPSKPAILNATANGPAWFVQEVKQVATANEEMRQTLNAKTGSTKKSAVVHQEFRSFLRGLGQDSSATIDFLSYDPQHLVYRSASKAKQVAVFSEMYYPAGWNCYVDGKLSPSFRVDYVLRAVVVPAGSHRIDWKFEPSTLGTGRSLSMLGSGLVLVLLFGVIGLEWKATKPKTEA